jgi:hypothetical protein
MLKEGKFHYYYFTYLINKYINLQLATSQYGVESSTPQPRILTAIKERKSLIKSKEYV